MSNMASKKYIVFHIEGGVGKNIMATAVVKALKKKFQDREIIVVSPHSGLWMNNPDVYRIYLMGQTPYFYEDFIKDKDTVVIKSDPYLHQDYINKKVHCIEAWCAQNDVEYNGEEPEIFLTEQEKLEAEGSLINHGKPILLLQTNGGSGEQYSWVRDMPYKTAAELCKKLQEQYKILHVRHESQPSIDGVDWLHSPNIRHVLAAVQYSHTRLLIDSFVQHASKAYGKRSTVLWPVDKIGQLGYDLHDNIVSSYEPVKTHMADYYLTEDDIVGQSHMCPFPKNKDIFDLDKILESIQKTGEPDTYRPLRSESGDQNALSATCSDC